jgi:hypothetical protein
MLNPFKVSMAALQGPIWNVGTIDRHAGQAAGSQQCGGRLKVCYTDGAKPDRS